MKTLLIYDVPGDRARLKVSEACLDYGLERIQYSAFFGDISANHLEELMRRVSRLTEGEEARVDLFPMCERDLRLRRTLTSKRLAPLTPTKGAGPKRRFSCPDSPRGERRFSIPDSQSGERRFSIPDAPEPEDPGGAGTSEADAQAKAPAEATEPPPAAPPMIDEEDPFD